jgi:multidrug efflux pump subunit AcrA (membrane-fusion protein)
MIMFLFLRINKLEDNLEDEQENINNIIENNVISQYPTSKVSKMIIKDLVKTTGVTYYLNTEEIIYENKLINEFSIRENDLVNKNQIIDISNNINSDFFGVITSIVQDNNNVRVTYHNYEKMGISVYVPQSDAYKLLYDIQVEIQFFQEKFSGKITKIANEYTEGEPKLKIDLEFNNNYPLIRPNALLNVNFIYKEYENVTCVNADFIYNSDGKYAIVYVSKNDKIVPIVVQIGMEYDHYFEILSGDIEVGDTLVKL